AVLAHRSWVLWLLGHPDGALADTERMLDGARDTGQATTLMLALYNAAWVQTFCGHHVEASALLKELIHLAGAKNALFWKGAGIALQGCGSALTGQASEAVDMITSGITAFRSTGATVWVAWYRLNLAAAYADLGQFDNASHCLEEAMTAVGNNERWCEAEVSRVAGELPLIGPEANANRAEAHFAHALEVARAQQAKSWELRSSMSLARLWSNQGKLQQARELLVPIYAWFTEGLETRDLRQAKALLEELA